ncbi:MAG: SpoIIE family protein phosphatase [Acidobacteriota bacterium]
MVVLFSSLAPALAQHFNLQRDGMPLAQLNGQFRFHAGDDPRYADPAFDDSKWSLLKSNESWYQQGYKDLSGFGWYRFSVTVPAGESNFALLLPAVNDSYAVYANGHLIGQVGEFGSPWRIMSAPDKVFAIPADDVPANHLVVFALRVWRWSAQGMLPGAGLVAAPVIGSVQAVTGWAALHVHNRFWGEAGVQYLALVNIAGVLLGFALFLVRPSEREYLWYGVAQVFWSLDSICGLAQDFLNVPAVVVHSLYLAGVLIGAFLNLIFFHVLLRQRRGFVFWMGGVPILIPLFYMGAILAGWATFQNLDQVSALCFLCYTVAVAWIIYRAGRRGNQEAWILFAPFSLSAASICWDEAASVLHLSRFPAGAAINTFLRNTMTWPIHANASFFIGTACNLAVCAVLILRFARTRRDEERLASEVEAARAVQHVLIPDELPSVPGYHIEGVYKPAGEVGGDFFQIVPLTGGGALIAIGDVSGKGMPAAMTVSLLVGTFRTLAHYTQSPGEILAAMNQRMLARSRGGFTTCLVLRLNADGTLTAANAGHLAPYSNGQEIEMANGLPLGLVAEAEYPETVTTLSPGDRLTLLTDGVVEARNAHGQLFGFERTRALSTNAAEHVATAAQRFGQEDDITVLSVSLAASAVGTS